MTQQALQKELSQLSSLSSKNIKDKIVGRLRRKVLPTRAMIEALPQKAKIEVERRTIPRSGLGRWILDVVLSYEKQFVK